MPTPAPLVVRLTSHRDLLIQRADAARLRDQQLEPVSVERPLVLDLSAIRLLSFSAADELIAKWILSIRNLHRTQAIIVALYSRESVIYETLDAALRIRGLAAYFMRRSTDPTAEEPALVGEVTAVNEETLRVVRESPNGLTAKDVAGALQLAPTAAANRLQELVTKGLIVRSGRSSSGQRGRAGARFLYPFGSSPTSARLRDPAGRPVRA